MEEPPNRVAPHRFRDFSSGKEKIYITPSPTLQHKVESVEQPCVFPQSTSFTFVGIVFGLRFGRKLMNRYRFSEGIPKGIVPSNSSIRPGVFHWVFDNDTTVLKPEMAAKALQGQDSVKMATITIVV